MRKIILSLCLLGVSVSAGAQESRHFIFHYAFTVNSTAGKRLRIWMPAAQSDAFQDVKIISAKGDLPFKKMRESTYGNQIYYAEGKARQADLHFDVQYDIVRHERTALNPQPLNPQQRDVASNVSTENSSHLVRTALTPREREQDLEANALVPITGAPAILAAKVTQSKAGPLDKARAIYDYVFTTMRYEKTGTGWGRGDVLYACDAKKGNCTDFHSLFIAMARSQAIPARFEIGFPIPEDKHSGEIAGYHCWSDFYVDGKGWIPVDISEAWKHPDKRDYFFGSHDANRVQFSMGRDLRLNPPQDSRPLNYFVYPYVEVDGKEYPNVSLAFSFADVPDEKARK
jgi:transglutaminase-like putative cysteine protease